MEDKNKEFLSGLVLGGVLGVVIGMMITPHTGEETRHILKDKFDYVKDFMAEEIGKITKKKNSENKSTKTVKKHKKSK
jgi:gas vesicle protein